MYVLSIDCGTQSLRAIVFDSTGQTLASKQVKFQPYYSTEPGYAEQDPFVFYNALCTAVRFLNENSAAIMTDVKAVTVTTQRDAAICMNKEGQPVRPAIIWADQRRIATPRKMALHNDLIFRVIGMKKTADNLSRNCKAHWIQDNEPEVWRDTYKYVQLSAFLNYQLTGKFLDGIASQIGHIPFSYKHFRYEHPWSLKHDIFHIEDEKLIEFVGTGQAIGEISEEASKATGLPVGLQVLAAGSDKGCETIGVGCVDDETISISLGSQASVQTTTQHYYETLMFIPPFQSVIPGYYNPEIQIYRGFWMVSWFKNEFAREEVAEAEKLGIAPEALLNEGLSKIPAGADGLLLQPYWGAGVKLHEAKGAIVGFSDGHTRMHIYRAIIEGIAYALYEGMLRIEKKSGKKIKKVMISGGGSQSDVICQIISDIFKLPVCRVQTYETSALGAAIAGYVGLGVHDDFTTAIDAMVHQGDRFLPQQAYVELYDKIYHRLYKKVYGRLKPLYKAFSQL